MYQKPIRKDRKVEQADNGALRLLRRVADPLRASGETAIDEFIQQRRNMYG